MECEIMQSEERKPYDYNNEWRKVPVKCDFLIVWLSTFKLQNLKSTREAASAGTVAGKYLLINITNY
jgi:hypothetical protein